MVGRQGNGEFPVEIASLEAGVEIRQLLVGEVLVSVAQQPADFGERIVAQPGMPEGVLRDAAADLVNDPRPETHDVEGIQHGGGVGHIVAERVGIPAEWVQRGMLDRVEELLRLLGEPAGIDGAGAARHHVKQSSVQPPVAVAGQMAGNDETELARAAERGQVRKRESRVRQVKVFRDDGVGTCIIGRPWLLSDAPGIYTLIWQVPVRYLSTARASDALAFFWELAY